MRHIRKFVDCGADEMPSRYVGIRTVQGLRKHHCLVGDPEEKTQPGHLPGSAGEIKQNSCTVEKFCTSFSPAGWISPVSPDRDAQTEAGKALDNLPTTRDFHRSEEEYIDVAFESEGATMGRGVAKGNPLGGNSVFGQKVLTSPSGDHKSVNKTGLMDRTQHSVVAVDIAESTITQRDHPQFAE
jgi:hypothetical protein